MTASPEPARPPRLRDAAAAVPRDVPTAERLARRLDTPMGALGVVFLFVVLGQTLSTDARLSTVLGVVGWVLWGVFVAELALRAYVAADQRVFWRRNWWQLLFLAVPFLRLLRTLRVLRAARLGGVLTSAVRGTRSTRRLLTGRIAWLAVVTGVVVLASSQVLYVTGSFDDYAEALHAAALATVAAEPLAADDGVAKVLEVALAVYSVAVFATLAGAIGAYFLERGPERAGAATGSGPAQSSSAEPSPR